MTRLAIAALAAALIVPAAASADVSKSITAIGSSNVKVNPTAQTDAAIQTEIAKARAAAGPMTVAAARAEAQRLAAASGLTLGPLTVVAEQMPFPFFGPYAYGLDGTFGPGKWCGTIRTPILRKVKGGGTRRTGKYSSHHGCRVPRQVPATVSVTFAAT